MNIIILIQQIVQTESPYKNSLDDISRQLHAIHESLQSLVKVLSSQSFWNSQLFGAIIGASSALLIILIQQIWVWWHKRKTKLDGFYKWIAEQYVFLTPDALYDSDLTPRNCAILN